jgi:pimeloyl-ACP methyl ester carboxylesterase
VLWIWSGILILFSVPLAVAILLVGLHYWVRWHYLDNLIRIFEEKPIFIAPIGQPAEGAEIVTLQTTHGLQLHGCYLRTTRPIRRGVILFGLEYGSNRWACLPYCEHLIQAGYDVFAFEPRGQGESKCQPGYQPMQWVTDHEVNDFRTAVGYLKARADADPRGIGFFGISKGGTAGLIAAASDPWVRCFVTDGIFATYSTMVPYMRKWFGIYNNRYILQGLIPIWYYGRVGTIGLKKIGRRRGCRFLHLEKYLPRISPRPLLMIHGGADTYIKPEMARALFERARPPREFWLVEGAKHNQALTVARTEYQKRVLNFFNEHLALPEPDQEPAPSPALVKIT